MGGVRLSTFDELYIPPPYAPTSGRAAVPEAFTVSLTHLAFAGAAQTASSAAWQLVGTSPVGPKVGRQAPPLLVLKQKEKQLSVPVVAHSVLLGSV